MNAPRTARDALLAELLGDIDVLLKRAEALPEQILDAESKIKNTVALIDSAGDRYRMAVTAFNEEAKKDLSEFASNKIKLIEQATAKSIEDHRIALKSQQGQFLNTEKVAEEIYELLKIKKGLSSSKTKAPLFLNYLELAKIAFIIIIAAIVLRLIFKFI